VTTNDPAARAAVAIGDDGAMAQRRGPLGNVGDMLRSLALVMAVVALLYLVSLRGGGGQPVRVVDYQSTLAQARVGAPYALVAPVGLPASWQATSVYFDPPPDSGVPGVTNWHVGFVTPDRTYAAFEQTNGPAFDEIKSVLTAPQAGSMTAGGWQRWTDAASSSRALVRTTGKVTIVVDGSASWAELGQLASSLQAQPPTAP
jgi:hypothetical protein